MSMIRRDGSRAMMMRKECTHCILHFVSFSTGIGCVAAWRERCCCGRLEAIWTHLVDLLRFEDVLHDFVVREELVLVLRVHLDSPHRHIAYSRAPRNQRP
jgi:hypothetical protein